jgi:glutamate/aspartate transport system substrate-binding protein
MNKRLALLTTLGLFSGALMAQDASSRLTRIRDNATMVISYSETSVPFSYIGKDGPIGFGIEIARRVADSVKEHLGLPELKIRWNPVTLYTRFPMVANQVVDLECVTTTNTRQRQDTVSFSNTFYVSDEGMAVRRGSTVQKLADLQGKNIAVARGTTTEASLAARGFKVLPERNNRSAMAALVEGRADAYVAATSIIAGEMLRRQDAAGLQLISSGGMPEAFGCMLPKGDAAYKQVVDAALARMMQSGEMATLYNKWFMAPIAPAGRTLGLPLNAATQQAYDKPNDTAFE